MAQITVECGYLNGTSNGAMRELQWHHAPRLWVLKGTITHGMKIHKYSPWSIYVRIYNYGVRSETKISTQVFGRGTSQIPPYWTRNGGTGVRLRAL